MKKKQQIATVPVEQIAGKLGGTIPMVLARLSAIGETPGVDWKGDAAVSPEVAARLVAEYEKETAESAERQAEYDAYLSDRARRRQEAAERAHRETAQEAEKRLREADREGFAAYVDHSSGSPRPQAHAAGQAAALEAVSEFDQKNPLKSLADFS